jgi:GNAT superfamily N-acetyltransferase
MGEPVIQMRHEFSIVSEKNETIATLTVERMHGVLWLMNLWTHHEHRRRGYARKLIASAIAQFGLEDLWLNVFPYTDRPLDTHALRAFYEQFGFEPKETPGAMCRRAGS